MSSRSLDWLQQPSEIVAPLLLGCDLVRQLGDRTIRCRIVETEAYDQSDAASHSYKGRTPRTDVMFGPAGFMYVYFTYGMHYCCNIVTGPEGQGSAVLLRAAEVYEGQDLASNNRHGIDGAAIANGPAKLCQALAIDKTMNGHDMTQSPLQLVANEPVKMTDIVQTVRVGISQGVDVPWRFYIKGNPFISRR
jgi:DNA-3-methyladenine glycosylase